jgi:hypothetical protein
MSNDYGPSPISFKQQPSDKAGVVEYNDGIGNKIIVWHTKGYIYSFQLDFQDHIFEYNKGRYSYFKNTSERSDFGYPAPPVTLSMRFTNKSHFRNILEFRSSYISPEWLKFIYQKIEEAAPNLYGL